MQTSKCVIISYLNVWVANYRSLALHSVDSWTILHSRISQMAGIYTHKLDLNYDLLDQTEILATIYLALISRQR